ncbi:MAG TPA: ABC transporter ATP-binding protein [Solirubrobacterales bacterium]|jgi:branched-chain amino acid transport system ATP-binding protein
MATTPSATATATATPILSIEDLEVRYAGVPALRGLSLEVGAGEIVGLVGPNGAGKSTTMLTIMGVTSVARGEVKVAGESILGRRTDAIARSGVALVPEGRHVFAELTVAENLRLGAMAARRDADHLDTDLDVGDLFPILTEFAGRQAGALSGGQQQQLAIARALLSRPRILLLDEPSLGLAPSVVEDLWGSLQLIRERGVTIFLVEQRAKITIELADRTHIVANGELRGTLRPQDANDLGRITDAYFGAGGDKTA